MSAPVERSNAAELEPLTFPDYIQWSAIDAELPQLDSLGSATELPLVARFYPVGFPAGELPRRELGDYHGGYLRVRRCAGAIGACLDMALSFANKPVLVPDSDPAETVQANEYTELELRHDRLVYGPYIVNWLEQMGLFSHIDPANASPPPAQPEDHQLIIDTPGLIVIDYPRARKRLEISCDIAGPHVEWQDRLAVESVALGYLARLHDRLQAYEKIVASIPAVVGFQRSAAMHAALAGDDYEYGYKLLRQASDHIRKRHEHQDIPPTLEIELGVEAQRLHDTVHLGEGTVSSGRGLGTSLQRSIGDYFQAVHAAGRQLGYRRARQA